MDEVGVLVGELNEDVAGVSWGGGGGWWSNRVWLTRVGLINKKVCTLGWVIEVHNLD